MGRHRFRWRVREGRMASTKFSEKPLRLLYDTSISFSFDSSFPSRFGKLYFDVLSCLSKEQSTYHNSPYPNPSSTSHLNYSSFYLISAPKVHTVVRHPSEMPRPLPVTVALALENNSNSFLYVLWYVFVQITIQFHFDSLILSSRTSLYQARGIHYTSA